MSDASAGVSHGVQQHRINQQLLQISDGLKSDLDGLSECKRKYKDLGGPNFPRIIDYRLAFAVRKLSKFNPDMILVIPVASGAPVPPILELLSHLELPMKTGVIIALDMLQAIERNWLKELESGLESVANRFVYVEPFFTTNLPPKNWLNSTALYLVEQSFAPIIAKYEALGFKDLVRFMYPYYVVREETRILMKHLKCRYVAWLDADIRPPKDVLARLLDLIEGPTGADLAAGWYLDRHYPFKQPSFDPSQALKPETIEDEHHIEQARKVEEALYGMLPSHNWLSPRQLMQMKEPIQIRCSAFGCVMLRKQLNDQISFFARIGESEDFNFFLQAEREGFKLFVDPECFCEHVEAGSIIGNHAYVLHAEHLCHVQRSI